MTEPPTMSRRKALMYGGMAVSAPLLPAVRKRPMANIYPLGPSGGPSGSYFNDIDDQLGGYQGLAFSTSISRVEVNAGDTLNHLQVTYQSGDNTIGPVQHGSSNDGAAFPTFDILLSSGERLHKIDGWTADFDGTLEVHGLQFTTTTGRQSGVLGSASGNSFVFEAPADGEIMAFWGRQGLFLDALGVFVRTS